VYNSDIGDSLNTGDEKPVVAAQGSPCGPWTTVGFSLIITAVFFATGILKL
jgi:hypothetical protein